MFRMRYVDRSGKKRASIAGPRRLYPHRWNQDRSASAPPTISEISLVMAA